MAEGTTAIGGWQLATGKTASASRLSLNDQFHKSEHEGSSDPSCVSGKV